MDVRRLDEMQAQGRSIFDTELAVAYYARVSTDKDEQINSLGNQKRYFEDYIAANPHWTFAGGYVDEGISGTSVEGREQFLRMIEDAKRGRFDLIITKEISRFARNTLDSLSYTRELLRFGVGVYFQNDNINTFDKDAELRLTIMSSIAQDEVRKLSERTRFGFKRAQENSVLLGQNNLFGYNKVDGRLEIVEHEAAIVREVFERYTAGDLGLRAIANDLERRGIRGRQGRPLTYSTLYGMIRNPKYKGCYAGRRYASRDYRDKRSYRLSEDKWLVHEDDRVPAIVPEAMWDEANRLLAARGQTMKQHAQASQNRYAYSGKLICAKHGTAFHRHVYKSKSRGEVECWNCKLYREKGKQGGCDSPTIYSHELDRILARVFEQVTDERSTAMQEYICAPLPRSRTMPLPSRRSSRSSRPSPAARTSCSISRLPEHSRTRSSGSAMRPATSSLPRSSGSARNCRMQTKRSSSAFGAWKACAALSRSGGRQTAAFRARCPRRSSTASS